MSQEGQPWAGLPRFKDHRSNRICISRHRCLGVPDHQSLAFCSAPGTPGNEAIPTGPGWEGRMRAHPEASKEETSKGPPAPGATRTHQRHREGRSQPRASRLDSGMVPAPRRSVNAQLTLTGDPHLFSWASHCPTYPQAPT